jgi:hypothetical protein
LNATRFSTFIRRCNCDLHESRHAKQAAKDSGVDYYWNHNSQFYGQYRSLVLLLKLSLESKQKFIPYHITHNCRITTSPKPACRIKTLFAGFCMGGRQPGLAALIKGLRAWKSGAWHIFALIGNKALAWFEEV